MRFHLSEQEMTYFSNLFISIANGDGVNRPTRRNLTRLANKFVPPRTGVFLKPSEKMQVINFAELGLKVMDEKFNEELPEDQKNHIEKVAAAIEGVLEKLRKSDPRKTEEEVKADEVKEEATPAGVSVNVETTPVEEVSA